MCSPTVARHQLERLKNGIECEDEEAPMINHHHHQRVERREDSIVLTLDLHRRLQKTIPTNNSLRSSINDSQQYTTRINIIARLIFNWARYCVTSTTVRNGHGTNVAAVVLPYVRCKNEMHCFVSRALFRYQMTSSYASRTGVIIDSPCFSIISRSHSHA